MKKPTPVLVVLIVALCSCATSNPTQFYTLKPMEKHQPDRSETSTAIKLGIGPVDLPEMLQRQELVVRLSDHQLDIADNHQWAAPIKTAFMRVLASNLGVLLPGSRIEIIPWASYRTPDYQIAIDVDRFDGMPNSTAVLAGRWYFLKTQGSKEIDSRSFSLNVAVPASDIGTLVLAQSDLIGHLTREIAAALLVYQGSLSQH